MTERIKITKSTFRTAPEENLWHLESTSQSYDEVAALYHQILADQEKAEKYDEELKQFLKTEDHNESLLIKIASLDEENEKLQEDNSKNGTTIANQDIEIINLKDYVMQGDEAIDALTLSKNKMFADAKNLRDIFQLKTEAFDNLVKTSQTYQSDVIYLKELNNGLNLACDTLRAEVEQLKK